MLVLFPKQLHGCLHFLRHARSSNLFASSAYKAWVELVSCLLLCTVAVKEGTLVGGWNVVIMAIIGSQLWG